MRVISGTAGGRRLISLPGEEITRPTTDRVKEAVFSIIQFEIEGKTFLDLFAGSGQMAVEAVSRGAEHAVCVDASLSAVNVIRQNVGACGFGGKIDVLHSDASGFLNRDRRLYGIAYLDPPYRHNVIDGILPLLVPQMSDDGVIICEISATEELPETCGAFRIYRRYKYSNISVVVYRHE